MKEAKDIPRMKADGITADATVQSRECLDHATVQDYAQAMTAGAEFPPVIAFYDGDKYWLADGFHRHKAAIAARRELNVEIRAGSWRDAVLHAAGANATHGLRRTNADKRKTVSTLLQDSEWSEWSDSEIARRCGVSDPFVGKLRKSPSSNRSKMAERKVTRSGKTYPMKTDRIGKKRTAAPAEDAHELEFHPEAPRTAETDVFGNPKTNIHKVANEAVRELQSLRATIDLEGPDAPVMNLTTVGSLVESEAQRVSRAIQEVLQTKRSGHKKAC